MPDATTPNNLPRQLTSFIGRDRELAEVKHLLATAPLLKRGLVGTFHSVSRRHLHRYLHATGERQWLTAD